MTRPNDFTLNTDYLALAQTGRKTIDLVTDPITVMPGEKITTNYDFPYTEQPGSSHRILIKIGDNGVFYLGSQATATASTPEYTADYYYSVISLNPNTIRFSFTVDLNSASTTGIIVEATPITIRITSFRPPNVI